MIIAGQIRLDQIDQYPEMIEGFETKDGRNGSSIKVAVRPLTYGKDKHGNTHYINIMPIKEGQGEHTIGYLRSFKTKTDENEDWHVLSGKIRYDTILNHRERFVEFPCRDGKSGCAVQIAVFELREKDEHEHTHFICMPTRPHTTEPSIPLGRIRSFRKTKHARAINDVPVDVPQKEEDPFDTGNDLPI